MSVSPVDGNSTIKIGDKTVTYTPPKTVRNPDGTWSSAPAEGMSDLAEQVNQTNNTQMDGDMFLKLLVAQLKYQDPSKPMDTAAMMQQTASLAMVQRMNEMATNVDNMVKATNSLAETEKEMSTSYVSMLMEQRMNSGVALVGRTVTFADATNPETKITGVVESVRFDKTGPILSVDGKDVPLTAVVSVQAPAAAPTTTGSTGATPATSGTATTGSTAGTSTGTTGDNSTTTNDTGSTATGGTGSTSDTSATPTTGA